MHLREHSVDIVQDALEFGGDDSNCAYHDTDQQELDEKQRANTPAYDGLRRDTASLG